MSPTVDGGTVFYLACGLFGLAMLVMAAHAGRRGTGGYRRLSLAMGTFTLASLVAGILSQFSRQDLAPGLPLTLEAVALALFVWAFLLEAWPPRRWGRVAVGVCLILAVGLLALGFLQRPGADPPPPARALGLAGLLLVGSLALLLWNRTRRRASLWLGAAFGLPTLGLGAGLLGLPWAPWLAFLLSLPLFTIEVYSRALAGQSANLHELQAASQRAERHSQDMARLLTISQAVTASLDPTLILEQVPEAMAQAVDADWSYVLLTVEDDPGVLTVAGRYGWWGRREQDRQLSREVLVPLEQYPLLDHAMQRRRQVLANRPEEYEQFQPLHKLLGRPQSGPTLVQPLHVQEHPLGAVLLGRAGTQRTFAGREGQFCQALAGHIATAIDNARRYDRVDEQAQRLAARLDACDQEITQSQAILASIADGVVVTNYAAEVIVANAAAERILGEGSAERLHDELLPKGGRIREGGAVFTWGDKEIAGQTAPVKLPDGSILGYVTVCRDVTGERRGELAKDAFIETVSQELRTSMMLLQGYLELLAAGGAGDVRLQQRRLLENASERAERMVRMLNNLIAVSETGQGPLEIEAQPVDMANIIAEAVQGVREQAAASQVDLTTNLPSDLSSAWGDPGRLRQIVDNLLDNALRCTPSGGRVSLWAAEAQLEEGDAQRGYLVVSIRDSGVGIPVDEQELIFEAFHRSEHPLSEEGNGAGLGLAIVKGLVEAHGGRVWVDSQPGQGSTFSFTVPTARAAPAAAEEEAPSTG